MLIPYPLPAIVPEVDQAEALGQVPDPDLLPVLIPLQMPAQPPDVQGPILEENIAPSEPFKYESNRETDKVESFADDKTVTFQATPLGLRSVVEILEQFANISGLRCNTDKSFIMYVVSNNPPSAYLSDYDFEVADSITILGIQINKHLDNLSECHNATVQKIAKIINFWSRFYLSLPGRINIAKTLILSQISYLGCIITPTRETLQHITTQINNFIVGGLNIAKDGICRPTELGGLGMIDLEDFITAQQVTWFKRAYISTRDNWRVDLKKIGNGNVLTGRRI